MTENRKSKKYDLEERTLEFSKRVIRFLKTFPQTMINREIGRQLLKSSTSIGENYIEANEALSKKDFVMRIKICRKESKETVYWLKLIEVDTDEGEIERSYLRQEATELMKIFGSILEKSK